MNLTKWTLAELLLLVLLAGIYIGRYWLPKPYAVIRDNTFWMEGPTNTVIRNNHFQIMPDVEVTNKSGRMYYQRKAGGTGVIFELFHSTNVVINGIKPGGYFTEIQFPDPEY